MPSTMLSGVSPRMDDAGGDAERPGRGRDQERAATRSAVRPVAGRELVLDQPVGGRGVRHAQQRLGQHHQRQPLLGRERIGVQEILDAAEAAGMGADALDQPPGAGIDARLGVSVARCRGQQRGRQRLVRRRIGRDKSPHARSSGPDWKRSSHASGSAKDRLTDIASLSAPTPAALPAASAGCHSDVQKIGSLCRPTARCRGPALLFHSACSLLSRKYKARRHAPLAR